MEARRRPQQDRKFYDRVWVYSPRISTIRWAAWTCLRPCGRRWISSASCSAAIVAAGAEHVPRGDYILVTGGGGDGEDLIRDVIRAYEADPTLTHKALMVLGLHARHQRQEMMESAAKIPISRSSNSTTAWRS